MILNTAAIVLKSIDFQESSKIVTLLTPEHGKVAVMVRGARKPKSKYAGFFEVGNVLDTVIYMKSSREVQNLTEVSYLQRNWEIRQDFPKLAVVLATMEMVDQLVHNNEASEEYFKLCENLMQWLNDTTEDVTKLFPYLLLRLAEISGIGVQPDSNSDEFSYFNVEDGMISHDAGVGLSFKLTPSQANYIVQTITKRNSSVFRNSISKNELKLLIHHIDVYFKHHIDGLRDRKSDAIFEQIL